jgi:hypothetical protein
MFFIAGLLWLRLINARILAKIVFISFGLCCELTIAYLCEAASGKCRNLRGPHGHSRPPSALAEARVERENAARATLRQALPPEEDVGILNVMDLRIGSIHQMAASVVGIGDRKKRRRKNPLAPR